MVESGSISRDQELANRRTAARGFQAMVIVLGLLVAIPFAFSRGPMDLSRAVLAFAALSAALLLLSALIGRRKLRVYPDCFFLPQLSLWGLVSGKDVGQRDANDVSGIFVHVGPSGPEVQIQTAPGGYVRYVSPPPNQAARELLAYLGAHSVALSKVRGRETWTLAGELSELVGVEALPKDNRP